MGFNLARQVGIDDALPFHRGLELRWIPDIVFDDLDSGSIHLIQLGRVPQEQGRPDGAMFFQETDYVPDRGPCPTAENAEDNEFRRLVLRIPPCYLCLS